MNNVLCKIKVFISKRSSYVITLITALCNEIFEIFNNIPNVSAYFANNGDLLKIIAMLEIHMCELSNIKNNYIE